MAPERDVSSHGGEGGIASPVSVMSRMKVVEICIERAEDGSFSVHVPILPGVHSQGENEFDAFKNGEDALDLALETYRERGMSIPWDDDAPRCMERDHKPKWVQVDA